MTRRSYISLLLAAALLTGCGVFSDEDAEISVDYAGPIVAPDVTLHVLLTDGGSLRASAEGALEDCASSAPCLFDRLATPIDGTVDVTFELNDAAISEAVVSGRIRLPLRPDWRWEVSFQPDSTNPLHRCFGCVDAQAFALPSSWSPAGDSLYVVWGGNSISSPVIY